MRMNKINGAAVLGRIRKITQDEQVRRQFVVFLILILFVLSLELIPGTLGRLSRSSTASDSAAAAKFGVTITAPTEFQMEQGQNVYEYYFLSEIDLQGLSFNIYNNGEADISCTPHLSNGIVYRVYVSGEERVEFLVQSKESVNFWLIIAPDGLGTSVKNAQLFIDIRQVEGG